jgi:hypothetical protein
MRADILVPIAQELGGIGIFATATALISIKTDFCANAGDRSYTTSNTRCSDWS